MRETLSIDLLKRTIVQTVHRKGKAIVSMRYVIEAFPPTIWNGNVQETTFSKVRTFCDAADLKFYHSAILNICEFEKK